MEKVNWNYWLGMHTVLIEAAVSLSLGHDHDLDWWRERHFVITLDIALGANPESFPDRELINSFFMRLRQLENHLEYTDLGESVREVSLEKFVTWGVKVMGWDMPQELVGLVKINKITLTDEPSSKPSIRKSNNDAKLIGALIQIIIQKSKIYTSEEQLKIYLDFEYSDLEGFSKRTLETKFRDAKKALEDMLPK